MCQSTTEGQRTASPTLPAAAPPTRFWLRRRRWGWGAPSSACAPVPGLHCILTVWCLLGTQWLAPCLSAVPPPPSCRCPNVPHCAFPPSSVLNHRCFNCGSYGHSLRDCWRELNRELVEESKR